MSTTPVKSSYMQLFSGIACFSTSVDSKFIQLWFAHGGIIALTPQSRRRADYYFCCGPQDPWLPSLLQNAIAVFDATWIGDSVDAELITPCASYVLDHPEPIAEAQDNPPEESQSDDDAEEDLVRQLLATNPSQKRRYEEDPDEPYDSDSDRRRPSKKARIVVAPTEDNPLPKTQSRKNDVQVLLPPVKIREVDLTKVKLRRCPPLQYEKIGSRAVDRAPSRAWTALVKSRQLIDPVPHISVKEALAVLQDIYADNCVLFVPSQTYCGKEFRCFRVDNGCG
ncbi:hypothetical protein EIP91_008960 [Steccherinum ochraceum]|uniref:BRCT domain-containing protein n=1 Tax=Steccherinum ochraceum TaxID=92696 RepID=A0A4R0RPG0_9APHY|nr:hypothetical protein EIP91_008960 [Steccherinum ochraceum]